MTYSQLTSALSDYADSEEAWDDEVKFRLVSDDGKLQTDLRFNEFNEDTGHVMLEQGE